MNNLFNCNKDNIYLKLKNIIDLVVFDMDLTVLDVHSHGAVSIKPLRSTEKGYDLKSITSHIVPIFKDIIPKLIDVGIKVAIATNSDDYMKGYSKDEDGNFKNISGKPLVECVLKSIFNDEIVNQFTIAAWMGNNSDIIGKNNHIARIWEIIISKETDTNIINDDDFYSTYRDSYSIY